MHNIPDVSTYLRLFTLESAERILESFPPLHGAGDAPSPPINRLLRQPYPGQAVAMMGVLRRWEQAGAAAAQRLTPRHLSRVPAGSPPRGSLLRRAFVRLAAGLI